jgi:hypothetical protein
MEPEPLKADAPKRKRRWFQFSLRTLMIVVTMLAVASGYVAHEKGIVEERSAFLFNLHGGAWGTAMPGKSNPNDPSPLRLMLGDERVRFICFSPSQLGVDADRIRSLFPEVETFQNTDHP